MRFKGIHYLNEPVIFDGIFAIMRPFMKEKILQRVSIVCVFIISHAISRECKTLVILPCTGRSIDSDGVEFYVELSLQGSMEFL